MGRVGSWAGESSPANRQEWREEVKGPDWKTRLTIERTNRETHTIRGETSQARVSEWPSVSKSRTFQREKHYPSALHTPDAHGSIQVKTGWPPGWKVWEHIPTYVCTHLLGK